MRKLYLMVVALVATLIDKLPLLFRRDLFRIAARSIGIKYAIFDGRQGMFEGPLYDRVIWPHYISQGVLDIGITNFIKGSFKSGSGTLIDVGANIGLVCIPVKREVPGIDVYAIEADPENCECLRMNAFRAGISDMVLLKCAAYSHECVLDFERSTENSGDHRVRVNTNTSQKNLCDEASRPLIKIQAAPLDSLIPLSKLKSPIVLKCDIQGAEVDVLAGATRLLGLVDALVIEFWPYGLKRIGANPDKFFSLISCFPYGARFDPMDETSIHLVPIHELTDQLRRIYAEETGILHYDLMLSKKLF